MEEKEIIISKIDLTIERLLDYAENNGLGRNIMDKDIIYKWIISNPFQKREFLPLTDKQIEKYAIRLFGNPT
tara:strand:+ start:714 stop:929 length:216 start_codon:yes stop_codon:yes gene_type:complete